MSGYEYKMHVYLYISISIEIYTYKCNKGGRLAFGALHERETRVASSRMESRWAKVTVLNP